MRLKARPLKINAQGHLVCMLNSEEADQLQIRNADRVMLTKGKKQVTAVVDVINTHHFLKQGQVGLMEELADELSVKRGEIIDVELAEEPFSVEYVRKKLSGTALDDVEMHSIISDAAKGTLSEEELSVFITACQVHSLSISEILDIINSLSGDIEPLIFNQHPVVDIRVLGDPSGILKHAISAVVSAAGIATVVGLESPGSSPSSSSEVFRIFSASPSSLNTANTSISKVNSVYIDQEDSAIPVALRRLKYCEAPLSLYPKDLLVATLFSLVRSLKSSHLYTCVLYGDGTPLRDVHSAKSLVRVMDKVSRKLRIKSDSAIFDCNEIFTGNSGPYAEAKSLLNLLSEDPLFTDLRMKLIQISGDIIDMVKGSRGSKTAKEVIDSGHALDHLVRIMKYHDAHITRKKFALKGTYTRNLKSDKDSSIMSFNNSNILKVAKVCGAPHDIFAGVEMHKKIHSVVSKNDVIATLHSKNKRRLKRAIALLDRFPLVELS